MAGFVEQLDTKLEELFRGWNYLSTVIAILLALYILYPIITAKDPDTHPLLLSRQANVSQVRQRGESAVYRSIEVPHGLPLKTGLNVRPRGASRYSRGKDGDLRDIWRRATEGSLAQGDNPGGQVGKILSIHGVENVEEHQLSDLSKQLNIIGKYVSQRGATAVGIYLPNSVELLMAVFAAAFYGMHPVLIPYDKPRDVVMKLVNLTEVDYIIAAAGSLPLEELATQCQKLIEITWVVEKTSRTMDWKDSSSSRPASAWHELVEDQKANTSSDLPEPSEQDKVQDVVTIWLDHAPKTGEIIATTQQSISAAVAAQTSALPTPHKLSTTDLFLPADSLTSPYILVSTLAALYSNATVALNTVSGRDVPISLAARAIAPTIIAASSAQALNLYETTSESVKTASQKYALQAQTQALKAGLMPGNSLVTKLSAPVTAAIGTEPGKLRLLYVFDHTNSDTPPMTSAQLSDLRAFTGARVIHALATAKVAGVVAQSHFYDYRREDDDHAYGHFGVPPSCVEMQVVDRDQYQTNDERARGEILVRGPAVKDNEARLGVFGEIRDDGTLKYIYQAPMSATSSQQTK